MEFKESETRKNLMRAYAGESQARNRYTFAAKKAKEQGDYMLEQVFLFTADQERAHAEVFYKHLCLTDNECLNVEGDYPVSLNENIVQELKDAAIHENEEYESIYPAFAKTAREEGYEKIAVDFEHIAGIEKTHASRFSKLLTGLQSNSLYKDTQTSNWMCLNCGFIYEGVQVPLKCPVCLYDQGYYVRLNCAPYTCEE